MQTCPYTIYAVQYAQRNTNSANCSLAIITIPQ